MKQPFRKPENVEVLKDLWNKGMPIDYIAEKFGVNVSTVKACRRRENLAPRNQGRRKSGARNIPVKTVNIEPRKTLKRLAPTFNPPYWRKDMDDRLFELAEASYRLHGTVYAAVQIYSEESGITLDAIQKRFHQISKITTEPIS